MTFQFDVLTDGLRFPEGPIARPDGSVLFVEIERGTLSRWSAGNGHEIVADLGGGPNGAAMGPDGAVYVCNNGGFEWHEAGGLLMPGHQARDYVNGSIQRVDLETGAVETLYDRVGDHLLCGPNDIVFDRQGGFWFSDLGKSRPREKDHGGLYYAAADGSSITEVIHPLDTPNGVGLSADEKSLYVALTAPRVLLRFDLDGPGQIADRCGFMPGQPVGGQAPEHLLDSLAVEADGTVSVGTLIHGGITRFHPDTGAIDFVDMPDMMATNICFGGHDMCTAFITCSTTGELVSARWPGPGLKPNFSGL